MSYIKRSHTQLPMRVEDVVMETDDARTDQCYCPGNSLVQVVSNHARRDIAEEKPEAISQKCALSKARRVLLLGTLAGAAFVNTLTIQAIVIVLPRIGADLHIPDSRLQWLLSAYTIAFGCCLLVWGRIADIYGKRSLFIGGTAWFALTTLISPFMKSEIGFNVLRGLQGVGAAANVPTALGIIGTTFPPGPAKHSALCIYAAGAPLGAAFGSVFAGIIAEYAAWKWIFITIALLCALLAITAIFVIPKPVPNSNQQSCSAETSVDWIGAVLIVGGSVVLLLPLTQGNVVGWSTPWIAGLIVVAVFLLGCFSMWQWWLERHSKSPLMKISIFRSVKFSAVMGIVAVFFSSFNNFTVYSTYFYQQYEGHGPLQTALRFLPSGIGGFAVALLVDRLRLLARVSTFGLLLFGTLCGSLANLLYAVPIPPSTNYFAYGFFAQILSVLGIDTAWPALMLFTSEALPLQDQALGGALFNTVSQVGRSIGLAMVTAIQISELAKARGVSVSEAGRMVPGDPATLKCLRASFWFSFALGMVSVALCFTFIGSGVIGASKQPKVSASQPPAPSPDTQQDLQADLEGGTTAELTGTSNEKLPDGELPVDGQNKK